MRPLRLFLALLLLLLATPVLLVLASTYSAPQLFGDVVKRVPTDRPWVALSFDDGPREPDTAALLEVLARHDAPATFFMTGEAMAEHPELAEAVVAAGHQVGNHSWSHPRFVLQGPGFVREEIARTDLYIREAGYEGPIHFRSPYGKKGVALWWVLARMHRTNVLFDVMPTDYLRPGVDDIVAQVLDRVEPGSIVVMHDGGGDRSQTVSAVDRLIPALRSQGYELVTVDALLALRDGQEPAR